MKTFKTSFKLERFKKLNFVYLDIKMYLSYIIYYRKIPEEDKSDFF